MTSDYHVLISSTMYLMTRYASTRQADLIPAITQHLDMLARHPEQVSDVLTDASNRMILMWQRLIQDGAYDANTTCGMMTHNLH